ncbi:hypothetical protein PEBR_29634 [Penicillium brasilianum]|uniref:Aminoglycoside phosphotransferase domain-containing protein n=1 Tax=Penicillium brasilianum TaxID=104259 RepID=A0A1S9RGC3_PENBI|nr:hypothetical protein PEBR_29634 [Penicillium brasilianum]
MPPLDPKREPLNPDRRLILTPSMIPNSSKFDAKDSRYFKKFTNLPSPEEVRKKTKAQQLAGTFVDKRRTLYEGGIQWRAPVVVFQELSLLVKWGGEMTISEGQCLYGIGLLLKDYVPVPELYGWRQDGGETFLYMEYLDAQTLEQAWDSLGSDDRVSISGELRIICANLRHLEQDSEDPFIGSIARSYVCDRAYREDCWLEAGPFNTVQKFHDWFTWLPRKPMPDPFIVPIESERYDLPDDTAIVFTHGDLHRSNILVTRSEPYRVVAIVDWEQSGWMPAYWEARKAQWTVGTDDPWSTTYLPMIMCPFTSTWLPWTWFSGSMVP